jgi:hypothetical protein
MVVVTVAVGAVLHALFPALESQFLGAILEVGGGITGADQFIPAMRRVGADVETGDAHVWCG